MSDSITYVLSGVTFVGGLGLAWLGVYCMDCISKPTERRRQVNLVVAREASETVRLKTLQTLFPEKKYQVREKIPQIEATKPDEGKVAVSKKTKEDYVAGSPQEEESNEEGGVDEENPTKKDDDNDDDASDSHPTVDEKEVDDVCAICIEHFQQDEFVMEGLECHHEYHRSCMMEWLHKHNDCPVCRKGMWTRDAFVAAKKQVLKANPKLVKAEMEAAQAVEDTMETAAAGDSAGDDNDQEHDEESPNSTATSAPATPGVL